MKTLYILASLFAAAQAQLSISEPSQGANLASEQSFTVQLTLPISSSGETGVEEVSLVIGIVSCGSSACPEPSTDLGEVLFIGQYESQGSVGEDSTFENFDFIVPFDVSGPSSIQVQHAFLSTSPGHAIPRIEYGSLGVTIASAPFNFNLHPDVNGAKCVGIKGGVFADGTPVDIFDCNESVTQIWQWNGNSLTSINPADGSQWCLDAGDESAWANGVLMKIWQCFSDLPQQTWTPVTSVGIIKLTAANFCLDLTNGDTTNQNVLQIWTCTSGDTNQIWTVTST